MFLFTFPNIIKILTCHSRNKLFFYYFSVVDFFRFFKKRGICRNATTLSFFFSSSRLILFKSGAGQIFDVSHQTEEEKTIQEIKQHLESRVGNDRSSFPEAYVTCRYGSKVSPLRKANKFSEKKKRVFVRVEKFGGNTTLGKC